MPSDYDLQQQGKQTHDLRHCDDPGCCVGVLQGRCHRCGFLVTVGTECPASEDTKVDLRQFSFGPAKWPTAVE